MRYIALFVGRGEGCDHTIDCNKSFEVIEAKDDEEAIAYCRQWWEDHGGAQAEPAIESIEMFRVIGSVIVPLDSWNDEEIKRREAEESERELAEAEARVAELKARKNK